VGGGFESRERRGTDEQLIVGLLFTICCIMAYNNFKPYAAWQNADPSAEVRARDPTTGETLAPFRSHMRVDVAAIADIVRAGAGLRPTAQIQLDTTIVDHGRADETAAPPPKWPLRLATSAALSLAGMCLILLARMRRMRRLRQQDPPASEG